MTTKKHPPLTLADANRSIQSKIRLPLPIVLGNCDYKERERLLCRMNLENAVEEPPRRHDAAEKGLGEICPLTQ